MVREIVTWTYLMFVWLSLSWQILAFYWLTPPLLFVVVYLFIYFGLVWFFRIWPVKRLKKHPRMWSKYLQYLLVQQIWFCKRCSDNLSCTTIAAGLPSIQEKFHLKVRRQKIVFIATSPWYKYYLQHSYARVGIRY